MPQALCFTTTDTSPLSVHLIKITKYVVTLTMAFMLASCGDLSPTVTRAQPNLLLTDLLLNAGDLAISPDFDASVFDYSVSVPFATSDVTLDWRTKADSDVIVFIDGRLVNDLVSLNLEVGINTVLVKISRQSDGNSQTYTVNITRNDPSNNANLTSISLDDNFGETTLIDITSNDVLTLDIGVKALTITAIPEFDTATVKINEFPSGSSFNVSAAGIFVFDIQVTAEDGATMLSYSLTVEIESKVLEPEFRASITSSVGLVEKYQDGAYVEWVTFGPVSRPPSTPLLDEPEKITGLEKKWGWLLVSDRYTVYKASYSKNSDRWDIARRVWNLGDDNKFIESMALDDQGRLKVNWVHSKDENEMGSIILNLADVKGSTCDPDASSNYLNGKDPGSTYFYRPKGLKSSLRNAIEFIPGTLPIIITAPHGGGLTPSALPIYSDTTNASDGGSQKAARLLADTLEELTGERPHLIINNIKRNRLNLNNKAKYDSQDADAKILREGFYEFISDTRHFVTDHCEKGLLIDIHTNGQSHWENILGVWLSEKAVNSLPGGNYDRAALINGSTIKNLMQSTLMPLDSIIVGEELSFGDIANRAGKIHTFPNSIQIPLPLTDNQPFFNGGNIVGTQGSRTGGSIDAIQIENHWYYINNGEEKRKDYIQNSLAPAVIRWMEHYYGFRLRQ